MSVIWFIVLLAFSHKVFTDESKRILLNDPGFMDNQQMHLDIQTLKAEVTQLQNKITDLNIQNLKEQMTQIIHKITDLDTHTKAETTQLKNKVMEQDTLIQKQTSMIQTIISVQSGSVYIRWGRKECPTNGTEIVYSGIAGGGDHLDQGRNANPVCVPHDPDLGPISGASLFGNVFGIEYKTNAFGSNLVDKDVPCAVCRANYVSSTLMIPGKSSCYDGWKTEYSGNLMSGHYGHTGASHYICVDGNPDVLEAGARSDGGYLLFEVKAYCGSLKCPPYVQDSTFKCVVCSK